MRAADLLVTLRTHLRDNQITQIVEEEEAVPLLHDEDVRRPDLFPVPVRLQRLPKVLARRSVDAPQFPVAGGPIDAVALREGGAEDAVEAGRLAAAPGDRRARAVLGEAEQCRMPER